MITRAPNISAMLDYAPLKINSIYAPHPMELPIGWAHLFFPRPLFIFPLGPGWMFIFPITLKLMIVLLLIIWRLQEMY